MPSSSPPLQPPRTAPPSSAPDDPRLGALLARTPEAAADARAVLVGFPSDEGVRRNNGRPGAAAAPEAVRAQLYRMTPDARVAGHAALLSATVDLGDVVVTGQLDHDQANLAAVVAPHLRAGRFVIILGGGHETGYGHFLGYVEAGLMVEIVNVDAHTDVRPLKEGRGHSGSPFRQAIEHGSGACRRYAVAGLEPTSVAASHAAFVEEGGGRLLWRDEIESLQEEPWRAFFTDVTGPALATFDMDAVAPDRAPGVSAPAPVGLSVRRWLQAAATVGAWPAYSSFELSEVNPSFDVDGRTARLAATTIWTVLRHLSLRESAP